MALRRAAGRSPAWSGIGAGLLFTLLAAAARGDTIIPGREAANGGAAADTAATEGLPIRAIHVVARNIFDPVPAGMLRPVYRLANTVHVRSREGTVRDQLLLKPGEVWTSERGREAARHLRTLDFLEPQRLEARRAGDSVDVFVETHDVWTTQPELDIQRASGRQFGSIAFSEHNLFGLGKVIAFAYREDPLGISRSFDAIDPGVGGSRLQMRYGVSRGTNGSTDQVGAGVPFYAEETPWAFGLQGSRNTGTAHLFQNNAEVAVVDDRSEETEAFVGHGWKNGDDVVRLTGSLYTLERDIGPTQVAAGANPPPELVGGDDRLRLRRVAVELRLWQPRYVERTGIERVDRVEDFDLGPSVSLKTGFAPAAFGSTADEGYVRARIDVGAESPFGIGLLRVTSSGRLRRGPEEWLDEAQGQWFWQGKSDHAVVAAVSGAAGYRMPRSFQLVVGGLNGLRAYPVHAIAGTELLRWNLEDRRMLIRDVGQLVSIGSAVFVDGARGWGPGTEGQGAYHAAGIGLRFAPPRAALGPVFRVDLAWPLSPTRDTRRQPVLSIGSSGAF